MAQTYEFYIERAGESAKAAKEAVLQNVRERELRSEQHWLGLAERTRAGKIAREKADAARMAKREAEAALRN
ncbi:hypothetical protein NAP1_10223 [Erythrobacter sp. NAP1]|uniref:hypothetical protein n=1 Tax=Erythrobacter sp. NAP1 TaxID=237727 RepID=UPI00006875BF|nr:hypothetical protein [Erythrobacter sp. NAP1]EAQ27962.1 hypothetical protein NAP1_10223 [Erythrobacter sp. NAP1]